MSLVCILGYFVVVMGNVLIVFRNLQNGCEAGRFLAVFLGFEQQIACLACGRAVNLFGRTNMYYLFSGDIH